MLNVTLSNLRDLVAPGSLRIELSVDARSANGPIDRVRLQQLVLERLEEDPDIDLHIDWPSG